MYTVSRAGRGESEELGDVHCIKGGESEKLGDVHCIKGRERGEGESG